MSSTLKSLVKNPDQVIASVHRIKEKLQRRKAPLPCYVYDGEHVIKNTRRFKAAFKNAGLEPRIYYALKSNPYAGLLKTLKKEGIGIDISSRHELKIARKIGFTRCVFTGPGKTKEDLIEIIKSAPKDLIIHLESFQELKNLKEILLTSKKKITCGIRVVPSTHAAWDKFGIPLSSLKAFVQEARKNTAIDLTAIHFHISYVKSSKQYCDALKEIATYLKKNFSPAEARRFTCIDIGGGLYPESVEGEYSWNKDGVLLFEQRGLREKILKLPPKKRAKRIVVEPIEKTAKEISEAFKKFIHPIAPDANLAIEPGRYLSYSSMHFAMQVVDRKNETSVITNAGWNMVGWEKFQYLYYSPVFNLTRWNPDKELPCILYGNLCIPDDIWGYYVHGEVSQVGDVLLLPFQGAYTYTYRQEFIRGIPPVIEI